MLKVIQPEMYFNGNICLLYLTLFLITISRDVAGLVTGVASLAFLSAILGKVPRFVTVVTDRIVGSSIRAILCNVTKAIALVAPV